MVRHTLNILQQILLDFKCVWPFWKIMHYIKGLRLFRTADLFLLNSVPEFIEI